MEEFVTRDIAVKLQQKGYNKDSLFAFNDEQVINPKVIEKYGALSDDGYYELTKHGGGNLEWDYVYIYQTKLTLCRNIIIKRNFVLAPTIHQTLKWLREKDIMIEILINLMDDGKWSFGFRIQTKDYYDRGLKDYLTWEEAAIAAINYCLNTCV